MTFDVTGRRLIARRLRNEPGNGWVRTGWFLLDGFMRMINSRGHLWKDLRAVYARSLRVAAEVDRPFPEPGRCAISPAGQAQIFEIASAQFPRPDLGAVLTGSQLIHSRDRPVHDTPA